ncbi:MAG: LD-carboxypeptidase, partial [Acidobacteria bacterium]|nr:LD-carboxypeptidase [Acidobacteriota bacterium]
MIKPRALKSGDRVAVVAPASPFDRAEFALGLDEVRRLGFEPVFDDRVFAAARYVAGPPEARAEAIRSAWRDPTIAAVLCVRGGYGSVQILPYLDQSEARAARKAFVGYSDLTSVLTFLSCGCGLVCFHGPTVAGRLSAGEDGYDRTSLLGALTRTEPLGELSPAGVEVLRPGEARGLLLGGTLTQLVGSIGTPFAFNPPDRFILFVDEVGERPYRVDRMWTQLVLSGLLARASAIVFGELPQCDEPGGDPAARAVVADLVAGFPGPV